MAHPPETLTLHASAVAIDEAAVLFEGSSGSGKSGLALTLMALGASLVADDRVVLRRSDDLLLASPPQAIAGRIEARGVGILGAAHVTDVPVALIVDLDTPEVERLPQRRSRSMLGLDIPVLHNIGTAYFAPAIIQYLKGGRHA